MDFDLNRILMSLVAFVVGITIHEWAHAITADKLGDPTPRSQGRVTLSPLAHLDPLGTVLLVVSSIAGVGFGWGRPVLTQPSNYKTNPRLGGALVSAAGPVSNLVLAGLLALVFRTGVLHAEPAFEALLAQTIFLNIALFFFNLIPVYPLDGSKLLGYAMPPAMADKYFRFAAQWGFLLFMALIVSRVTSVLIGLPTIYVAQFLMG